MSRLTIAVDRVVALVLALLMLVLGVAAVGWGTRAISSLDGPLHLGALVRATDRSWWPWSIALAGVVLVALGLRWLIAHLPRRSTGALKLTGSGTGGRLLVDGNSLAQAAADALANTSGIRSARGRVVTERGQLIARLQASIEADADLSAIAASADQVSAQLRAVLGRDDLYCLVQLQIPARALRWGVS